MLRIAWNNLLDLPYHELATRAQFSLNLLAVSLAYLA
jgi:hypothetical protein